MPARRAGAATAETFPRKAPKREGRLRRGAAFVLVRADGCVLLRSRPPKGLLGGMTEVPTTEWSHDFDETSALKGAPRPLTRQAEMAARAGRRHARVHAFPAGACRLCRHGAGKRDGARGICAGLPLAELPGEALPNVMRKVLAHALGDDIAQVAITSP